MVGNACINCENRREGGREREKERETYTGRERGERDREGEREKEKKGREERGEEALVTEKILPAIWSVGRSEAMRAE